MDSTNNYLTIKQIADSLQTSKQRVYRCIKANHIKEVHHDTVKGNTVLMYDKQVVELVRELLTNNKGVHQEVHQDTVKAHHDVLYDTLLKQLEIKDKQIADLMKKIDTLQEQHHIETLNLQQSLNQEQQLFLLNSNPIQTEEPIEQVTNQSHWWQKLFKK